MPQNSYLQVQESIEKSVLKSLVIHENSKCYLKESHSPVGSFGEKIEE
jgi:hypothetical protein